MLDLVLCSSQFPTDTDLLPLLHSLLSGSHGEVALPHSLRCLLVELQQHGGSFLHKASHHAQLGREHNNKASVLLRVTYKPHSKEWVLHWTYFFHQTGVLLSSRGQDVRHRAESFVEGLFQCHLHRCRDRQR